MPLNSCWLTSPQFHLPFSSQHNRHDTVAFPFDHGFQHSIVLSCVIILVSCTIIQSHWIVDCYLWVQRSSTLGPQHFFAREELWRHEQPSVKSAREQHSAHVFESCCPKSETNKDTQAAQLRATGMQRGVAIAGSTAVRSSSLLLSATLLKCRTSQSSLRKVSGKVTSTGTLRNGRLMLSSSRYGGQKSGCRSNGKHSPRVRRNNDCGKGTYRKSCWKNRPNTRVSSWSGRFAVAREWLTSEPKCTSHSCDGQRMPSRAWLKRLPKWSSQSAAGGRTSCKGLLKLMPKVQTCHLNMPTWAICRDRVAKRKRLRITAT